MDKELPNGIGLIWWNSQVCSFDGSNPGCGNEAVNLRIYNGNTNKYYLTHIKHIIVVVMTLSICALQVLENKTIDFDLLAGFKKLLLVHKLPYENNCRKNRHIDYDKLGDSSS